MSGAAEDGALPAALRFMLAAGRRELESLQDLVATSELATLLGQFVHDLQKERGWSNIYLGQPLPERLDVLEGFSAHAVHSERELRRCLEGMDLRTGAGRPRLLARIAHLLDALEGLPRLRRQVREQRLDAAQATAEFTRLIGSLLAAVFEAADGGMDPAVTRSLVAMFNFMQGKELAGQERATGVAGFSAGWFDAGQQATMQRLREGQQRCFAVFGEHACDGAMTLWTSVQAGTVATDLLQLRKVAERTGADQQVAGPLAEIWFDVCTRRIDAMREVENLLAQDLLQVCRQSIDRARAELDSRRMLSRRLAQLADSQPLLFSMQASTLDHPPPDGISPELNRSILDRVREQALRLQQLDAELAKARAALQERHKVELAKRRLEAELGLSEQAAHERLQRISMESGARLVDVAAKICPDLPQPG